MTHSPMNKRQRKTDTTMESAASAAIIVAIVGDPVPDYDVHARGVTKRYSESIITLYKVEGVIPCLRWSEVGNVMKLEVRTPVSPSNIWSVPHAHLLT